MWNIKIQKQGKHVAEGYPRRVTKNTLPVNSRPNKMNTIFCVGIMVLTALYFVILCQCFNQINKFDQIIERTKSSTVITEPVFTANFVMEPVEEPMMEPEVELKERFPVYDVPISLDLQSYIHQTCEEYKVNYELVLAVICTESQFEPDIISGTHDYGLMQINVCNHDWLSQVLGVTDFLDPKQNVKAGIYMLSTINLQDESGKLMVYNMGYNGASACWKRGIYSTSYSEKVLITKQAFLASKC